MVEIATASGTRQYDWGNKIVVSLNPLELAELVTDPDKEEGHNFYHDTCAWGSAVCAVRCAGACDLVLAGPQCLVAWRWAAVAPTVPYKHPC